MSTMNSPNEEPEELAGDAIGPDVASAQDKPADPGEAASQDAEGNPSAPELKVPKRLAYTSVPALATSLVLSAVLFMSVLFGWYAIGPDIRGQISGFQAVTLLTVALGMLAIMMSVGYSRLYTDERGVIIRNGPVRRKFTIDQVAGLRLRDGDPWAYLLVKDGKGGVRRRAVLAIQQLEGVRAKRKVTAVRRWLKANGASSKGITLK